MVVNKTNSLYIYDNTILTWLKSIDFTTAVYGATPEGKAVVVRFQALNTVLTETVPERLNQKIIDDLPEITVVSADPQPDISRRGRAVIRKSALVTPEGGGEQEYRKFAYPLPYTLDYQVDIWTRLFAHQNQILYELLLEFDPEVMYLTTDLAEPFGSKWAKVNITDITDNSELEREEKDGYVQFRKTINLKVDIWLWQNKYPDLTKRIEQVRVDFYPSCVLEPSLVEEITFE